ncbi:F0F1 ATP synthase subunit epsilon [Pseudokineococcus marinus]|uniref:ATP synthase epsilon chain n=1 Tax=Pseudokineococcus marinus TaxID=351215 RepID=A0A849BH36_9ACTN|nr:F0F1 ATP synthase subunit epsilon [Pseudokineococcus marinus]NNH22430.1 F0F1 ATP synthase subunit epsilon [Pseudokineococcus marinus]
MADLHVELVSAERQVWAGGASRLSVRTVEGEIGVLPGHEPILAVLADGEVRIEATAGESMRVRIGGGFLSVDHDRAVVVAEDVDLEGAAGSASR